MFCLLIASNVAILIVFDDSIVKYDEILIYGSASPTLLPIPDDAYVASVGLVPLPIPDDAYVASVGLVSAGAKASLISPRPATLYSTIIG